MRRSPGRGLARLQILSLVGGIALFSGGAKSEGDVASAEKSATAQAAAAKLSLSSADMKKVLAGGFVKSNLKPSSGRELSVALVFLVRTAPGELAGDLDHALAIRDDSDVLSFGEIDPKQPEVALSKVVLSDDAARRWLAPTRVGRRYRHRP